MIYRVFFKQFVSDTIKNCSADFALSQHDLDFYLVWNPHVFLGKEEVSEQLYKNICRALDCRDKYMDPHSNAYHEAGRAIMRATTREELVALAEKYGF